MKVVYYDQKIKKFIDSLEKRTRDKVYDLISLLEEFGSFLSMPHSKKVVGDVFELRIKSKQEVRIFYTFYKNKAVLLSGFIKDSNKIPNNEISKAINRNKQLD